jgi:DNA-binding IclR family transcriptional regulator
MQQTLRTSDLRRPHSASEIDPQSRVAIIMAQVESLAEEARATELPPSTSARFVRSVIAARAARRKFFDGDLFADPAWDILLELYALRCEQRRTSVSKLCLAAAVPSTTALRWLEKLHADGLIERDADPFDARRVWVSLSDRGFVALTNYLRELAGAMPL